MIIKLKENVTIYLPIFVPNNYICMFTSRKDGIFVHTYINLKIYLFTT